MYIQTTGVDIWPQEVVFRALHYNINNHTATEGGVCKVAALISSDWGVRTTAVPNGNVNIAVCLLDGGQTLLPPPTPFFSFAKYNLTEQFNMETIL